MNRDPEQTGDPYEDTAVPVLLGDPDEAERAFLSGLLTRAGYPVREATNGDDVLAQIQDDPPGILLLCASLPDMGGLATVRQIRNDPARQGIGIILATPELGDLEIASYLEAGVDEYVTKPFIGREVLHRIRSMARLYRSQIALTGSNAVRGEQARSTTLLLDYSREVVGAGNFNAVLDLTLTTVAGLTCCRQVSIMLPDDDERVLEIAGAIGIDKNAWGDPIPIDSGVAGRVFTSGEPVVINSVDPGQTEQPESEPSFSICTPLVAKGDDRSERVIGVLNVMKPRVQGPFEAPVLGYVDLVGNIAASAIDALLAFEVRDEAYDSVVVALATLAEYRDNDTGRHLERVTQFALILAEELREFEPFRDTIDARFLSDLRRAVPLHDIGKVGIPDRILLKPGRLTVDEMALMRLHAEKGGETIRSVMEKVPGARFLKLAEEIASGHHEHYDGDGYPRGLVGEEIPPSARIVALVDVYDALTTRRVYKDAMPHEKAVAIIREGDGSHFDPAVVRAFLKHEQSFALLASALSDDGTSSDGEPSPVVLGVDIL